MEQQLGNDLPVYLVLCVISAAFCGLIGLWIVRRRFADLKLDLASAYHASIAVPPDEGTSPRLVALAVDLVRKSHCSDPFEKLTPRERRLALHGHAVEVLPTWMSRLGSLMLPPRDQAVLAKLRLIKSSRPARAPQVHGIAVERLLQARRLSNN